MKTRRDARGVEQKFQVSEITAVSNKKSCAWTQALSRTILAEGLMESKAKTFLVTHSWYAL